MNFLEDILEYFDQELITEGLEDNFESIDLEFLDQDSLSDFESISKIQEVYNLEAPEAEEFLEILQSIQHSIGDELGDIETISKIDDYIDTFNADPSRIVGLINNVKGIYGEHEVIEALKEKYTDGQVVLREYATNAKDVDLRVFDESGNLLEKIQVKVSDDPSYILNARANLPDDIKIVTTDEVIENIISRLGDLPEGIEGIGLSHEEITSSVERTISILSETEPEFEMLIHDPVISEHLASSTENPFLDGESYGRQVHADKRYNHPVRWVYRGDSLDFTTIDGAESFNLDWDPSTFDGVGDPLNEAQYFRPQVNPVSCAIATQRNIIESLTGETIDESYLIQLAQDRGIFNPSNGTMSEHLASLLRERGFECADYARGNFEMIENALKNGSKVIIGVDASEISNPLRCVITGSVIEQPDMLHCLQVTGVDYSDPLNLKVVLSDPGDVNGAMKAVSLSDFSAAWEDAHCRLTIVKK